MTEILEAKMDKSNWGEGPWQTEPDRVEWEHNGHSCMIIRNYYGVWCGYVAVTKEHPCYEKNYSVPFDEEKDESEANYPTESLEVHGGLTYANHCQGEICHVPKPGQPDDVWWLGFDCGHHMDLSPAYIMNDPLWKSFALSMRLVYRDMAYAKKETNSLADQLAGMKKMNKN